MSSTKWRPLCPGLNVLKNDIFAKLSSYYWTSMYIAWREPILLTKALHNNRYSMAQVSDFIHMKIYHVITHPSP